MNSEQEVIKHAAVKAAEGGMIFIGKCHAHCFYKGGHVGVEMSQKADDQGFFTSKGRYVNRQMAMAIALNAKQVSYNANYLISEMLWSERDAGLFDYDEIEGYKLKVPKESKPEQCPSCGTVDFAVARDMKSTRHCPNCLRTWLPGEGK